MGVTVSRPSRKKFGDDSEGTPMDSVQTENLTPGKLTTNSMERDLGDSDKSGTQMLSHDFFTL